MSGYERVKAHRARNTQANREGCRAWRQKLRSEAFAVYGERCSFCGEDRMECLTIDHIENDGKAHRASLYRHRSAGHAFYSRLRRLGWPKDGLQVLCWNCNMGKKINGGVIPALKRALGG